MVKLVRDIGSVIVDGNNESNLVNVTFGQFVGDDVVVSEMVYVVLDWDFWLGADSLVKLFCSKICGAVVLVIERTYPK
jgi:hypothetical protein